jgi:hypothetical protein
MRKQLDEGIGNTLVSGAGYGPVLAGGRKEQVTPRHSRTIKNQNRNTEGIADTFVQLFSSRAAGSIASIC